MASNTLRSRRAELGLSAEVVAVRANVTAATLYDLESGRRVGCRLHTARALAAALETTVDTLFPPDVEPSGAVA